MTLDNFRTIELIWDKANKSIIKTIRTASSDTTGRYLSVKILDGGQEVTFEGATLQLYWEHPNFNTSGTDIFKTVNNSGLFNMTFSKEMLTNIGELNAHLMLTLPDGKITSDGFKIEVIKGTDSGIVVPTNGSGLVEQIDGKIDKGNVTLNDLTQEVKLAMTGGSVAVVGKNSVGTENIKGASVTREKTDFVKTGKNILDPSKLVRNKIISANDGKVYDTTSGNGHVAFIPVLPNQKYIKNWTGLLQHAFYDGNFNFISGETSQSINTPKNCEYVSVNIDSSDLTGKQIELGDSITTYEPFYTKLVNQGFDKGAIAPEATTFSEKTINLLDKNKVSWGRIISANTGLSSESGASYNCHTDYIPVDENTTYRKNISNVNQVAFYDGELNFLSGVTSVEWTTPNNAAFARANLDGRYIDITQIAKGDNVAFVPYGNKLKDGVDKRRAVTIAFHTGAPMSTCYRLDGLQNIDDVNNTYPFSEIKLCNVSKTAWGATKVVYEGESGFKRDGSNGEVMSEIPKHYFKRWRKDSMEYISISGEQLEGYQLDPAFIENGKELDKVYVGVYDASVVDGKLVSRSGAHTDAGNNITEYRDLAKATGEGFGLYDYRTYVMLQRLFMCYFADRNSQAVLGMGLSMYTFQTGQETIARLTESNTNKIRINHTLGHYQTRGFAVGMVVTVSPEGTYGLKNYRTITALNKVDDTYTDVVFNGDPVDIVDGVSRVYSIPQNSGATDSVAGHTGVSNKFDGRDGHEAVKFLHIENLWGNVWTLIDGYLSSDLVSYVGENMSDYSSEIADIKAKYLPLANKIPLQPNNVQSAAEDSQIFIRTISLDGLHPAYMLPEYLGSGATPNTMFSDPFYSHEKGDRVMAVGGGIDHWYRGGLFSQRVWFGFTTKDYILLGARLIFKDI